MQLIIKKRGNNCCVFTAVCDGIDYFKILHAEQDVAYFNDTLVYNTFLFPFLMNKYKYIKIFSIKHSMKPYLLNGKTRKMSFT